MVSIRRPSGTVSLTDSAGAQIFNLRRPFGAPRPRTGLGDDLIRQVVTTAHPVISPLFVGTVSRAYATAVAVRVRRHVAQPWTAPPTIG